MKAASALAATLALISLPLPAQDRDAEYIRTVRQLPANLLDPVAFQVATSFERVFSIYTRVPVVALEWQVNDCGEGEEGRKAPTCVEVRAELAPDVAAYTYVSVADADGKQDSPRLFMMYLKQGSQMLPARSMRELTRRINDALQAAGNASVIVPSGAASASGVTAITLERTWCYGACPIDRVELRADGNAVYTGKMNTGRTGNFTGVFDRKEFTRLAQWLGGEGFFQLPTSHGEMNVDADSRIMSMVRDGKPKWVVNYGVNPSPKVQAMESMVLAVAALVTWKPVTSGIRGSASWRPQGESWRPAGFAIQVHAADDQQEFHISTGEDGSFEIPLAPGTYRIQPLVFGRAPQFASSPRSNPSLTVVVRPDGFEDASFRFDHGTGSTTFAGSDMRE